MDIEALQNPSSNRTAAASKGARRMPTIYEVARRAGVSVGTVSHVLNGTARARPDTERRVLEAVEQLGYVPNPAARALVTRRSYTIGVAITSITNPVNAEIVAGIEEVAMANGYTLLLAQSGMDDQPHLQACLRTFCAQRMDGVIGKFDPPAVAVLSNRGIPVVTYDVEFTDLPADTIRVDYRVGVFQALRYLRELGHRRVAFIAAPAPWQEENARLQAYRNAVRELHLDACPTLVVWGHWTRESGRVQMHELLQTEGSRPTAVLAANDLMAIGAMDAAQQVGLTVPDDVSIIGMDDGALGEMVRPTLSTVSIHAREVGKQAMELLLMRTRESPSKALVRRSTTIPSEFVARGSIAPPRAGHVF